MSSEPGPSDSSTAAATPSDERRRFSINAVLLTAWAGLPATHVMFLWDLGDRGFGVGAAVFLVPLALWLGFGGHLPPPSPTARIAFPGLMTLYFASFLTPVAGCSYAWRHEDELLARIDAIRRGDSPGPLFGFEGDVEESPFRVYWPRWGTWSRSRGLLFDPSYLRGASRHGEDSVLWRSISRQHAYGPWYVVSLAD